MKKKGFTLIELLVVIAIIAMLLAILMPALNKVKKIAQRVVCGTNLKGLGTAQTVYANDYDDEYAVQGGKTNPKWESSMTAALWDKPTLPWGTAGAPSIVTVGSSLYLLVREADVSPKSFICPASDQTAFDGKNSANLDIIQLWDFGLKPFEAVSYSYHQPYKGTDSTPTGDTGKKGRFAANGTRSAAFAVMGDRNPFFDTKLNAVAETSMQNYPSESNLLKMNATTFDAERWVILGANAQPHDREGQNVLFADGHTSYETRSDVGVKNDNIFTMWSAAVTAASSPTVWRMGNVVQATGCTPKGQDDSVLVNDIEVMTNVPHRIQ